MSKRTSIDPAKSIEELEGAGWEPVAGPDVYQPDPLPDMRQCKGACWRTMHEIATRNPRAALVLLASAMGGMSELQIGQALHVDHKHLPRQKAWLRKHYPGLASTLKR